MIKILKIELIYFFSIFLVLALLQHPDLLTSPLDRLQEMQKHANYLHPFIWTSIAYFPLLIVRTISKFIMRRFKS